jgi:hypothetical protein
MEEKLRRIGTRLFNSRNALEDNYTQARSAAAEAAAAGISHRRIAELLGVDRMTLRKWVWKR